MAAQKDEPPPPEPSAPAFDVGDPEPSHTMFQKGRHMNGRELKEILKKMEMLSKKTKGRMRIDASHVLIRGLRRGVGIYNEELPGPYLQIVQKFAQKGRLGAVFSDESLAYGVNMPFRTSAFVGDPGPEILDALVAQQAVSISKAKESVHSRIWKSTVVDISIPPPFFQTCFIVFVTYLLLF